MAMRMVTELVFSPTCLLPCTALTMSADASQAGPYVCDHVELHGPSIRTPSAILLISLRALLVPRSLLLAPILSELVRLPVYFTFPFSLCAAYRAYGSSE